MGTAREQEPNSTQIPSVGEWTRRAPLDGHTRSRITELWEYARGRIRQDFEMEISVGKPLDVLALKGSDIEGVRRYAAHLEEVAEGLYGGSAPLQEIDRCPACGESDSVASVAVTVFKVPYVSCPRCGHAYVRRQPTNEALQSRFAESEELSAVYVDRDAIDVRMDQIIGPKAEWVLDVFSRRFGRVPRRVVDVGAGGGHFVAEMQRRGIDAVGFEPSRSSQAFAQDAFGIELRGDDFSSAELSDVEVITFWGMLEYAPRPAEIVSHARRLLSGDAALIVAEVPRLLSLGTAVQAVDGAVVARHMDPTSHLNCFTDASMATLLVQAGFKPAAAWYFGMDAFELVTQVALRSADPPAIFDELKPLIAPLQAMCDLGRIDDDLVMAAVL
jgi:2-polyprenyl-3-methyl-5-hydroxy-6-metoxy-1,4-benzoquinol methylase